MTSSNAYADYDWVPCVRQEVLREIPDRGAVVLDAGCGTDRKLQHLNKRGNTVVGYDVSAPGVPEAASRIDGTVVCDVEDGLPFGDGEFDVVFSSAVLERVYPVHRVCAEMYSVVWPGGRAVNEVPTVAYWPNRLLLPAGRELIWIGTGKHIRAFTKANLVRLLEQAEFDNVHMTGTILPLPGTELRVYLPRANRLPGLCLPILAVGRRASC